mgnify:FL=1
MAMKARVSLNVLGASLLAGPHSFLHFFFPSRLYLDATAWRKSLFCIFPIALGSDVTLNV